MTDKKEIQVPEHNSIEIPEYKSIEKRIEERILAPTARIVGKEIYNFGRSFYGTVATFFRIPTAIRKCVNNQELKENIFSESSEDIIGTGGDFMGSIMGGATDVIYTLALLDGPIKSGNPNYFFYGWLATNLLSGVYELGRLSRSKLEYQVFQENKSKSMEKENK